MTSADTSVGSPSAARLETARRLVAEAMGSRSLQRLTDLAARLLDCEVAQVSLLGEVQTAVAGSGLPPGGIGMQRPLDDSLCAIAVSTDGPLVVADAVRDGRVRDRAPVRSGRIGAYLGIPLRVDGGEPIGALCVYGSRPRSWSDQEVALLRQIADSVSTELQLMSLTAEYEAHRLRTELAIDAAGIGSFDWNLVTGRLLWDDRMLTLLGYERADFDESIGSFVTRVHPDDRERTQEALQSAIETVGEYEAEFRVVLPSGETRWIRGRGRAVADDRGTAVRLLGAGYDTTPQRQEDVRIARLLEAMKAAFFSLDRDWRFSYVNAEAERVLGAAREQLIGGVVWELFPAAVGSDFERYYRAAVATGDQQMFEAYYPPPLDAWFEVRAWPTPDGLSVSFLDVTERRAAEEQARRSTARLGLVADTTTAVSAPLDGGRHEEEALQRVAELLVPELGDWVIISRADPEGRLRYVAGWHRDPALRDVVTRYARTRLAALPPDAPVLRAIASGEALVVPDVGATVGATLPPGEVSEAFWALRPQSALTLPLAARGRTLGALSIYRSADRPQLDDEDASVARDVAGRVALALDNARLYDQQRRLAEGLQRSLLTAPPQHDSSEIVVRYHPAMAVAEVGGDWYDAFLQPSGAAMLVIGDVVGHDTEAAAAMGQLRGMLRGIAYREGIGPAGVLTDLDAAIQGLRMGTLATAAIVRLEQTDAERAAGRTRLRWSNAGHPPPLVLHPDGSVEELAGERAELMLGVDAGTSRSESVVTVLPGSTVLLYTDGLVEGRDLSLDEGMARLRAALGELSGESLPDLCDAVIERLRPEGLQDDVALVALRLHPQH
ncbi:SpoIIE family protein phosphatase [Blastococcus xanthinilyticus]|uniref:PAS domain S-box-containing protein n=1 Tax=Blastococcus xanthinilyticus TaxID=1564164 RepID=A0A5S5CS33_9ACTN|nr:SpoIIE family protein phosphatase [Blastococcus xanthinilyticus]TYP86523.1 PAS domain S-box-containing protein [Blastococcus xanthinilyticus]